MRSPQAENCLSMADYFCLSMMLFWLSVHPHALQPLALVVASVHVFRAVAHSRLFTSNLFCLVFSDEFNIMSALFVHQSLTLPQKNDSREGLF